MPIIIVAVRDSAVGAYMQPSTVRAPGQAIRGFQDEANRQDPQNTLWAHPEDFELWQLGYFDEETGDITMEKQMLIRGKDAKRDAQES